MESIKDSIDQDSVGLYFQKVWIPVRDTKTCGYAIPELYKGRFISNRKEITAFNPSVPFEHYMMSMDSLEPTCIMIYLEENMTGDTLYYYRNYHNGLSRQMEQSYHPIAMIVPPDGNITSINREYYIPKKYLVRDIQSLMNEIIKRHDK